MSTVCFTTQAQLQKQDISSNEIEKDEYTTYGWTFKMSRVSKLPTIMNSNQDEEAINRYPYHMHVPIMYTLFFILKDTIKLIIIHMKAFLV